MTDGVSVAASLATADGLGVRYPSRDAQALDGVDLDVADGERVLVVGPSGSGKSTLLHVLCGLVPGASDADVSGHVRVGGLDPVVIPVPELVRTVGLLGQDPASQVCLPLVADELAFVLENRAVPPAEIGPRVTAALASVGLAHLDGRRTASLSGGELQRVALAATLLGEPRLLLLDEPTAALDPVAAHRVGTLLGELAGRGQSGVGPAQLVVEHRFEEVADLPPRTIAIGVDGRLVADGPTAAVFAAQGPALADGGAWVPLAVEVARALERPDLAAYLTGADALLDDPEVARLLVAAARRADGSDASPGPAGPVALEARGATFADGDHVLVRDVDVSLRTGTVTAVVGANGSGKTSLLLGLAGLLRRVAGTLEGDAPGVAFQHPEDQFVGRTVATDIAHGLSGGDVDARVAATLDRLGLTAFADADPHRLSGGQKRRVAVAAMVAADRATLLFDEPTSGQDRGHAREVEDALVALARDGRAVAFTTHDLRGAARIADRVLVVADGRIVADAAAADVLADGVLLERAGLRRPALLDRWTGDDVPLRGLLRALDPPSAAPSRLEVGT